MTVISSNRLEFYVVIENISNRLIYYVQYLFYLNRYHSCSLYLIINFIYQRYSGRVTK